MIRPGLKLLQAHVQLSAIGESLSIHPDLTQDLQKLTDSVSSPLCRSVLILSPTLMCPEAIRPVATLPKKESRSVMVTSMANWPDGSPGGAGTCSSMASNSGDMLGSGGVLPGCNSVVAQPCAPHADLSICLG